MLYKQFCVLTDTEQTYSIGFTSLFFQKATNVIFKITHHSMPWQVTW